MLARILIYENIWVSPEWMEEVVSKLLNNLFLKRDVWEGDFDKNIFMSERASVFGYTYALYGVGR